MVAQQKREQGKMCKRNIRWKNVKYFMIQCGNNKSKPKNNGFLKAQP